MGDHWRGKEDRGPERGLSGSRKPAPSGQERRVPHLRGGHGRGGNPRLRWTGPGQADSPTPSRRPLLYNKPSSLPLTLRAAASSRAVSSPDPSSSTRLNHSLIKVSTAGESGGGATFRVEGWRRHGAWSRNEAEGAGMRRGADRPPVGEGRRRLAAGSRQGYRGILCEFSESLRWCMRDADRSSYACMCMHFARSEAPGTHLAASNLAPLARRRHDPFPLRVFLWAIPASRACESIRRGGDQASLGGQRATAEHMPDHGLLGLACTYPTMWGQHLTFSAQRSRGEAMSLANGLPLGHGPSGFGGSTARRSSAISSGGKGATFIENRTPAALLPAPDKPGSIAVNEVQVFIQCHRMQVFGKCSKTLCRAPTRHPI